MSTPIAFGYDQVQALTGYSPATFRQLVKAGKLPPPVMLSPRKPVFLYDQVKAAMQKLAATAACAPTEAEIIASIRAKARA